MNLYTFLLISKDSELKQLLHAASPQTSIHAASTISEGLALWSDMSPTLVVAEGNAHTLAPLLEYARQRPHSPPLLVIGDRHSLKDAVETMRAGAADYLAKPILLDDLKTAITRTVHHPDPAPSSSPHDPFASIISVSPQMNLMKQLAKEVALTDAIVLITGESGTGKELFAEAIHHYSPRAKGPLIALNCAGIPENLLESELFGYESGAFTDAKRAKPGRFQLAEGGTLFLDEIGEMSSPAQAKLLRVLENHTIDPLGDTRSHKVNIRIIAATNEDLLAHIKAGRFRLDLYYRLNVYQLRIPPLRERLEDIEPILLIFLERTKQERGCRIRAIDPAALAVLHNHDWPGNVRELHNVVEWLTITCKAEIIQPAHLPASVKTVSSTIGVSQGPTPSLLAFGLSFQDMEKRMLEEALRKTSGNISEASRLLKMTRNTLRYRITKYHLP
ncbi:MAG: sigma-54 dependent transcriptional regulator [Nitrospira sp.]|nr:sigma-54 dependent transcriptional regulator [Nitrospira sp.]MDH4249708.1 sigma-54 dependent transcriptional regulator [Nitrospira sp.]MDH4341709.1 sigma-54 dependent transcriptional regulator [Nitrospira sp.]MDH5334816.1 sigma-54 dependent transcriptional regulator [Nitrospira sp.]